MYNALKKTLKKPPWKSRTRLTIFVWWYVNVLSGFAENTQRWRWRDLTDNTFKLRTRALITNYCRVLGAVKNDLRSLLDALLFFTRTLYVRNDLYRRL